MGHFVSLIWYVRSKSCICKYKQTDWRLHLCFWSQHSASHSWCKTFNIEFVCKEECRCVFVIRLETYLTATVVVRRVYAWVVCFVLIELWQEPFLLVPSSCTLAKCKLRFVLSSHLCHTFVTIETYSLGYYRPFMYKGCSNNTLGYVWIWQVVGILVKTETDTKSISGSVWGSNETILWLFGWVAYFPCFWRIIGSVFFPN